MGIFIKENFMTNVRKKLMVLLAVFFISFSPIIIKLIDMPSLAIAFLRMFFTILIMSFWIIGKKDFEFKNINTKNFWLCILSGLFLGLHFAVWITSLDYTTVASSTILVNLQPIIVFVLGIFILKERFNLKKFIIILLVFAGSIIISYGDFRISAEVLFGDLLAIAGAFFVAVYLIIGKIVRKDLNNITYTYLVYLTSTIALFAFTVLYNIELFNYPIKDYFLVLLLAVTANLLGHSILNWAIKDLDPSFVSTSVLGEPLLATLWAIIIFDEIPHIGQLFGGILIIIGIYKFFNIKDKQQLSS
jgi:drug/metabolite transporter (DMT)-like permease